ncbi:latrophilin receptor-like protein A [Anneissia japonica]|uniref:latrophilin receptor-like protein A n=1 Tax=Anneissia japonica TaxID=1529436 RepID=UPI001425ADB1|nr:latrophilin receptor-like protein A [Anneissia japonica]
MYYINQSQSFLSLDRSLFRHQYKQYNSDVYNSTTLLLLCSQNNVFGLTCPFIHDEITNYVIVNKTLKHIRSGKVYGLESYELTDNQTVKICSTFGQTESNYFLQYNTTQTILSVIGCILSLIALVLTFLVYCLLSSLRTLPGMAVMSFNVTLFWAQFLLTFGAGQTKITAVCKVIAITMHFFWLASFFWMSVLAYDISQTFKTKTYDQSKGDKWKTFVKYSIIAWGSPFVIVAICVMLSMTVESLGFEYGSTSVCWISDPVISLVIFGGPVAFALFLNSIFFGMTVHGVRETIKASEILHRNAPNTSSITTEMKIYFKITSLMGFSWIFGFIAGFTGIEFLWYVFIVLCTLQGVFVFVSFVCNNRVCSLLRERYQAKRPIGNSKTMTQISTVTSI